MVKRAKTRGADQPKRSLAPAVDRALDILFLLETAPQKRFPLAEIARRLSIPKSTVLNICEALERRQALRRSADGYQLGRRLVQLGSSYVSSVDLVREFYEVCRAAPEDLKALIQLSVLDDELNAVYLAREDCDSGLRLGLTAEIGRRVPANCTASGKALLAALEPGELDERLKGVDVLPTLTPRSIHSPEVLRAVLAQVRSEHVALDDEETLPGIACVAAATRITHREDGLVAVSISAAKPLLDRKRATLIRATLDQLIAALQVRL
jgi:IclR family transcriptional regulator, blcABC operon repressor